jgi:hypothetical protein
MNNIMDRGVGYNYGQPYNYGATNYPARNQIQWVLGIENAKSYPIQPNSSILLMDSEQPRFYIKSADQNGMCSIKSYDFTETVEQTAPKVDYVTKEEFDKFVTQLNEQLAAKKPLL